MRRAEITQDTRNGPAYPLGRCAVERGLREAGELAPE
jgi:hypothetical protein